MNIKTLVIIFGFLSLLSNVNAQNKWIKHRFTYKVGGGHIYGFREKGLMNYYEPYGVSDFYITNKTYSKNAYIEMCATYGVNRWLEVGVHGGGSFSKGDFDYDIPLPFYGVNVNIQLMPLFLDVQNYRFDLYVAANAGGLYVQWLEKGYWTSDMEGRYNKRKEIKTGHKTEAGIGLGGAFYLTRRIGLYSEFTVGKYVSVNKFRWIYGVTFKF